MTDAATQPKRRFIKGSIFGLIFGLGVALLLFLHGVIATKSLVPYIIVIVAGDLLGTMWALIAPPKRK